ncbi:hypothetical protein [Wenxinia marina]|uniref:Uncharacterized protein n=1 Tax=Wenxinia marina DSM 24838 TaxID=1123501 RepID=A0A0D0NNQ8_9RHOB|nr:hypothetical protein [Wenxinia marina]KIQ69920.1 hypothetical protein Wenmar_01490 [Wenxinia marina DSM 24838]GGL62195.1 hypothetical protein GCM10011392_15930 [Wenxinia marina]
MQAGALFPALGALALTAPALASAQSIDPDEFLAFDRMNRILNRTGSTHSSIMGRDAPCLYSHRSTQRLGDGVEVETRVAVDYADVDAAGAVAEPISAGSLQLVVPLREGAPPVRYDLTLYDITGKLHRTYIDKYGATCDGWYCDASTEARDVYLTVTGDTAETDIDTVAEAVTDLAAFCAARDSEGD